MEELTNVTEELINEDVIRVIEMEPENVSGNLGVKLVVAAGVVVTGVVGALVYKRHKAKKANEDIVEKETRKVLPIFGKHRKDEIEVVEADSDED